MKHIYIRITDFNNQGYVVKFDGKVPATAASVAVERTPQMALKEVRQKVVQGEAIECEIAHSNNHAPALVIFHGPVTITYHKDKESN